VSDTAASVLVTFLYILIGFVVVRALLSWLPLERNHPLVRTVVLVTDPLLEPLRRILPTAGAIDFSGLVMVVVLSVMISVVRQAAS
jgi:YggT family protein